MAGYRMKVVIIALVLFVALMNAAKTTAQAGPITGTPVDGGVSALDVITLTEGKLITLPFAVGAGDVVILEIATIPPECRVFSGNVLLCAPLPDPSTWAHVVRFCDDPFQDPCTFSHPTTHVFVMSADPCEPPFTDKFTGHFLDASKVLGQPPGLAVVEDPSGTTAYFSYLIVTDPYPETSCVAVGGIVTPTNTFVLLSPWLAVIGLVVCIGTAAVIVKRRRP